MSQEAFEKEIEAQRGKGGRTVLSVNKLDGRSQLWEHRDGAWHFVSAIDVPAPHPYLFRAILAEVAAKSEPPPAPPPAPTVMDATDEQLIEWMDGKKWPLGASVTRERRNRVATHGVEVTTFIDRPLRVISTSNAVTWKAQHNVNNVYGATATPGR